MRVIRRIPTPTQPSVRPAMAIPRPPIDGSFRVCESETCPKMTARIDPIQNNQRIPRTIDATARPLVEPRGGVGVFWDGC